MSAKSKPSIKRSRQLIVCGFHRSGTSLTMQALKNAGLYVGENLMPAHPSNPDGHFEDNAIVALHNDMLSAADRQWHSTGGPLNPDHADSRTRAAAIINDYSNASDVWGFKDPRSSLFLEFWHNLLPRPGSVLIYRHYLSCLRSLKNRQAQLLAHNPGKNLQNLQFWQDPQLGLKLWLDSNLAILRYHQNNRNTSVLVSCEEMLAGFNLVDVVNDKFGLTLDASSDSGIRIKPSNAESASLLHKIPDDMRDQLQTTLEALNDLADSPASSTTQIVAKHRALHAAEVHQNTDVLLNQLQIRKTVVANTIEIKRQSNAASQNVVAAANIPDHTETIDNLEFLIAKVESLSQQGDKEQAVALAANNVKQHSSSVKLRLALGKLYLDQENYALAETHIKAAQLLNPQNAIPIIFLGMLEKRRQNPIKSAHYWKMVIDRQPNNAMAHFQMAQALDSACRPAPALQYYDNALALEPDNQSLCLARLQSITKAGKTLDALAYCESLLEQFPGSVEVQLKHAELMTRSSDTRVAMQFYYRLTWLKMQAMHKYRLQLQQALDNLSDAADTIALGDQVNAELSRILRNTEAAPTPQNAASAM